MIRNFIDRSIIPFLMVGKRFDYGPYDKMTQLGSGQRMDAYIFSDEIEVEVHRRLFGTSNVHFAKYPSISNCSCKSFETKKTTTPKAIFV